MNDTFTNNDASPNANPQPISTTHDVHQAKLLRLVIDRREGQVEKPVPKVGVRNTLAELVDAFTKLEPWQGVLAWNEFTHRIVFRREPPFKEVTRLGDLLRDEDIVRMRLWFELEHGVEVSRQNVLDAVRLVAMRSRFHPVADYLTSLTWDGIPRVDAWLEEFCSVQPSSPAHQRLIRAVARKWLVSCVARVRIPPIVSTQIAAS